MTEELLNLILQTATFNGEVCYNNAEEMEIEAQKKARKYGLELSSLGVDVEVVNAYEDFGKNDMGNCTPEEIQMIKSELNIM